MALGAQAEAKVQLGGNPPLSASPRLGLEALKERFLRHVKAPAPTRGEHSVQLSIICKDSTPSGQVELRTDSLTVTLKDRAEEPVATKPGLDVLCEFVPTLKH